MADWANLPIELLFVIAKKLVSIEDFLVFSVVCKGWFGIYAASQRLTSLPTKFPWLMLSEDINENSDDDDDNIIKPRSFFNLSTKRTYVFELPEASMRKCLGVNYGWVLTLGSDINISLLHPITRNQIALPPFLSFNNHIEYDDSFTPQDVIDIFIRKAVLSSNPYVDEKFHVMAIYGQHCILAFATPGVNKWTDFDVSFQQVNDVVYYKGHFYAVDESGTLVFCYLGDNLCPSTRTITPPLSTWSDKEDKYLVESSGGLLLILRMYGGHIYNDESDYESEDDILLSDSEVDEELYEKGMCRNYTINFSVFKMESCRGSCFSFKWVEIESLGGEVIFLGNNSSKSLSASEHNGRFKADCIYFTENKVSNYERAPGGGGRDMGVFDIHSKTIEPHYDGMSVSHISPPFWVI